MSLIPIPRPACDACAAPACYVLAEGGRTLGVYCQPCGKVMKEHPPEQPRGNALERAVERRLKERGHG